LHRRKKTRFYDERGTKGGTEKMDRRRKRKDLILTFLDFVLMLNLLSIPLYFFIYFGIELKFLKNLEALLVSKLLNLLGLNSRFEENLVLIDNKIYEISWDSTGWKSLYTLFALIASTPIYGRRKIKPLIIGLFLVSLFNVARITATIHLSYKQIYSFDFLHLSLWRWGSIGFLLFIWLIFLYTQKNNIGETKNIIGFVYGRRRKP
jgi:exosortase/archaeosortase family protein